MKTISLNKGSLNLPDCWDDLFPRQKIVVFKYLKELCEDKITPSVFRLHTLKLITDYKPQSEFLSLFLKRLLYVIAYPIVFVYSFTFVNRYYRATWRELWIRKYRPKKKDREVINYNLFRLSEQLDFAFTIQDNTISLNNEFKNNPIPYLIIDGRKYEGKKFIRDIAPFTNITGREFSDCFDLYLGFNNSQDIISKDRALNKIISILYPSSKEYNENLVSEQPELIANVAPEIKFGIYLWFSGIVQYYLKHEYYSILFRSSKTESTEDKINLGMNQVMLMITKQGYNENDNLNNFFDAQLKILMDNLSEALAKGVKIQDLAESTGLSINDINKLT